MSRLDPSQVRGRLDAWIWSAMSNLTLGNASVDLVIHREIDNDVSFRVSRMSGSVRVSVL
jgi:hypothetical protein